MERAVICIVKRLDQAERVVGELRDSGFESDPISALFPAMQQNEPLEGGVLRGALGWLVSIESLALPGLAPLIAAGPILAALSGLAAGAAVGGLASALAGLGIPAYEAERYAGRIADGEILISVHTDDSDMRSLAAEIFEKAGAEPVKTTGEATPV